MKALWKFLLGIAIATPAYAVDTEAQATAILRFGEKQLRGESTQAMMTMVIKKPGYTRMLKLRSWAIGAHKALVEILEPAKERGIASLRVTNQMWNYLPKTDQVVRVPTSMMLQSWMGSDFTNDDLMKTSSLVRDYRHRIVKTEKIDGQMTVQIECLPKPGAPVVWGRVTYWARQSDQLPVRESYYDERGKWVRTLKFSHHKKVDDRVIPTQIRVDVAESKKQHTTITYQRVLFDRAIDENVFSRDLIRRTVLNAQNPSACWSTKPIAGKAQLAGPMGLPAPSAPRFLKRRR